METSEEVPPRSARQRSGIFYGWWVVVTGAALYALGSGVYWVGFSFYFLPVKRDLELSTAAMSLAPGLARLVSGVQGPLAGYLVDRLGPRFMIASGGCLAGLGLILLGFTHSYFTFLLVYLGLIVIGFTGGFDQGIMAVTNRWFIRRKARAMSLLWLGLALGSAFVAPGVGMLVLNLGWRATAAVSGGAILLLMVPAVLVVRNLPEGIGLTPDGPRPSPQIPATGSPGQQYQEASFTARQGFRTASYWLLALALGLRVAAQVGLLAHFVPIIVWKGQTEATAAVLIGLYGFLSIPLCLLMGWTGDRWSKQRVTSFGMLLGGLGLAVLILSGGQLWALVIFIALYSGADNTGVVAWALVGDLFGRKAFATLLGGITLVYSLLSASVPIVAGWIFDATGSYVGALVMITLLFASAGFIFWNLPKPKLPVSPETPPARPLPLPPDPLAAPSAG